MQIVFIVSQLSCTLPSTSYPPSDFIGSLIDLLQLIAHLWCSKTPHLNQFLFLLDWLWMDVLNSKLVIGRCLFVTSFIIFFNICYVSNIFCLLSLVLVSLESALCFSFNIYHEFHENHHSVTFHFMKKDSKQSCDTTTPESIHTKDESKRGSAFAFIFGVNWPVQWM